MAAQYRHGAATVRKRVDAENCAWTAHLFAGSSPLPNRPANGRTPAINFSRRTRDFGTSRKGTMAWPLPWWSHSRARQTWSTASSHDCLHRTGTEQHRRHVAPAFRTSFHIRRTNIQKSAFCFYSVSSIAILSIHLRTSEEGAEKLFTMIEKASQPCVLLCA